VIKNQIGILVLKLIASVIFLCIRSKMCRKLVLYEVAMDRF